MNRPIREDSGSSVIIKFSATVERPAYCRSLIDASLLALNSPAAWAMLALMCEYQISRDGTQFGKPPTPQQAGQDLINWIRETGESIASLGLMQAAKNAVFPVPESISHDETLHFFVSKSLPSMSTLLYVLFSLGISDTTITGASLLLHRARHPTGRFVKDHDTTGNRPTVFEKSRT
jgi:hypothetical protein